MPFSPGLAAMPERGARMPIRTGLFWAMAGENISPAADSAPMTAVPCRSLRRVMDIYLFLPFSKGLAIAPLIFLVSSHAMILPACQKKKAPILYILPPQQHCFYYDTGC